MTELVFSKVAGLQSATLLKCELLQRYFSRIFNKDIGTFIFRNIFPVAAFVFTYIFSQKLRIKYKVKKSCFCLFIFIFA